MITASACLCVCVFVCSFYYKYYKLKKFGNTFAFTSAMLGRNLPIFVSVFMCVCVYRAIEQDNGNCWHATKMRLLPPVIYRSNAI